MEEKFEYFLELPIACQICFFQNCDYKELRNFLFINKSIHKLLFFDYQDFIFKHLYLKRWKIYIEKIIVRNWMRIYFECHYLETKIFQKLNTWEEIEKESSKYHLEDFLTSFIYERGLEKYPNCSPLLGNYANFFRYFNEHEKAKDYYKKAIEIEPLNPYPLANYANLLQNQLFKHKNVLINKEEFKSREDIKNRFKFIDKLGTIFVGKHYYMKFCFLTNNFYKLEKLKIELFEKLENSKISIRCDPDFCKLLYKMNDYNYILDFIRILRKDEDVFSDFLMGWYYSRKKLLNEKLAHEYFGKVFGKMCFSHKNIYFILKFYSKMKNTSMVEKWINEYLSFGKRYSTKIVRILKENFKDEKFRQYLKTILNKEINIEKIQKFKKQF